MITLQEKIADKDKIEQELATDEAVKRPASGSAKPPINSLAEGQVHIDKVHGKARIKSGGEIFVWNVTKES